MIIAYFLESIKVPVYYLENHGSLKSLSVFMLFIDHTFSMTPIKL